MAKEQKVEPVVIPSMEEHTKRVLAAKEEERLSKEAVIAEKQKLKIVEAEITAKRIEMGKEQEALARDKVEFEAVKESTLNEMNFANDIAKKTSAEISKTRDIIIAENNALSLERGKVAEALAQAESIVNQRIREMQEVVSAKAFLKNEQDRINSLLSQLDNESAKVSKMKDEMVKISASNEKVKSDIESKISALELVKVEAAEARKIMDGIDEARKVLAKEKKSLETTVIETGMLKSELESKKNELIIKERNLNQKESDINKREQELKQGQAALAAKIKG